MRNTVPVNLENIPSTLFCVSKKRPRARDQLQLI